MTYLWPVQKGKMIVNIFLGAHAASFNITEDQTFSMNVQYAIGQAQ